MINTEPIEFTSIEEIAANSNFYFDRFKKDGILVFRNANLTIEQQEELQLKMADAFNYYPNIHDLTGHYVEDHSMSIPKNAGPDEIMLDWHIEHVYLENPIVLGIWNMHVFNTDPENGKTYFYDSRILYDKLPVEWKEFLSSCIIDGATNSDPLGSVKYTKPIMPHWLDKRPTIRIAVGKQESSIDILKRVNDRPPTTKDHRMYSEITAKIKEILDNDTDNRIVHRWQVGDIVIPDMFTMVHSVTGGFKKEDRVFTGMWSFPDKYIPRS
jgi:alpha-ketoglutarate-dependent taurine dioxygenase